MWGMAPEGGTRSRSNPGARYGQHVQRRAHNRFSLESCTAVTRKPVPYLPPPPLLPPACRHPHTQIYLTAVPSPAGVTGRLKSSGGSRKWYRRAGTSTVPRFTAGRGLGPG